MPAAQHNTLPFVLLYLIIQMQCFLVYEAYLQLCLLKTKKNMIYSVFYLSKLTNNNSIFVCINTINSNNEKCNNTFFFLEYCDFFHDMG